MSHNVARRLRPYLFSAFRRSKSAACTRAFTRCSVASQIKPSNDTSHDYEKRVDHLQAYKPREEWYPRLATNASAERVSAAAFEQEYGHIGNNELRDEVRTIIGTMTSVPV